MSSSFLPGKVEPSLPFPALISSLSPLQRRPALEPVRIRGTSSFQNPHEAPCRRPAVDAVLCALLAGELAIMSLVEMSVCPAKC